MMSFDETGQYQFVIKEQNCTASVRRTRTFRLLQREGEAAKPLEKDSSGQTALPKGIEPEKTPKPSGVCATKGEPARLEVRPARKLMRAGESFKFRAVVLDKKGCALGNQPTWKVDKGAEVVELGDDGTVEIKADAGETEVTLSANVKGQSVQVAIEVVPRDRYDALLAQRGFNEAGESSEAAAATLASGSIGAKSVVSRAGSERRTTFIAITGALALVVGVLGLVLVQRRRRRERSAPESAPLGASFTLGTSPTMGTSLAPPPVLSPANATLQATGLPKHCPSCGRQFFADEQFCTEDATLLVATSLPPPPQPDASMLPPASKICPICGTQYPSVAEFCGKDGSTLVPVN